MVETVLFWALALYGAVVVVWQVTHRLQMKLRIASPVTYILVVHNNEAEIEGVVRNLFLRTAMSSRDRQILVLDCKSTDDTPRILQTLSNDHACLRHVVVADEVALFHELESACLHAARVVCIYDLRPGAPDISTDLTMICQ